jgi:hypothetical protein
MVHERRSVRNIRGTTSMKTALLASLFLLLVKPVFSQLNPQAFYPLQVGNEWQFHQFLSVPPNHFMSVLSDSIMPNGNRYFFVKRIYGYSYTTQYERTDSAGNTWLYDASDLDHNPTTSELPLERLSAPVGSSWSSFRRYLGDTATIVSRQKMFITLLSDSLLVTSISYGNQYGGLNDTRFAEGIGPVYEAFGGVTWHTLAAARVGSRTYGVLVGVDRVVQEPTPSDFALKQNYPNPFNPSTTISYFLPKLATVSLRIFNSLGQEVTLLVNEPQEPGHYQAAWNASSVPSGVYFYRLQAGAFVEIRKMLLIK